MNIYKYPEIKKQKGPTYAYGDFPSFPVYLKLMGNPYQCGYDIGKACKESINYVAQKDSANSKWGWQDIELFEKNDILKQTYRLLNDYEDFKMEAQGIADGASVSIDDILLLTLLPEACVSRRKDIIKTNACTMIAELKGTDSIVANNIDNPPLHQLIHIKTPNRLEYLVVGYLGRFLGGAGMNESGLSLAEVSIPPFYKSLSESIKAYQRRPVPDEKLCCGMLLNRKILASCRTADQALDLFLSFENAFRSTATLICDATGKAVIVSRTIGYTSVLHLNQQRIAWPNVVLDENYTKNILGLGLKEYINSLPDDRILFANPALRLNALECNFLKSAEPFDLDKLSHVIRNPAGKVLNEETALTLLMQPSKKKLFVSLGNKSDAPWYQVCFGQY